ncbi:PRC-barrel domain-containing protein [Pannus brasiliensis CCIBt3594]|uniref:PRC-barrel domain-containing protein n=1 Tax=Pannus brasiliensis CCIBt3594 TaxID=1427578 RepID=A0AAW9QJY8_9CHRO
MITEHSRLRSEFLNTQVITRNTGKKLGVVKEILVDIDQREVVALGLRDNILSLSGMPQYMYLSSVSQTGDVILVEDDNVIESVDIDAYTPVIGAEVITETGEPLGKVRDYQFDALSGKLASIIIASIGLPQIPEQLISTYELSIEEVVSSGPNRLIVFEGAEERLTQMSVGVLERLGIGRPPWEREEEEAYYPPTARPENQLGTGIPIRTPVEAAKPVEERWSEDEWEREPIRATPSPQRRAEALRYEDDYEEEDNWGESRAERTESPRRERDYDYEESAREDVWDDDVEPDYNPPRINITEKKRIPEYEEG